jgi:assimilatory nitrate reductase catalytic subunit
MSDGELDALEPVQWPLRAGESPRGHKDRRFFMAGHFFTPDRRGRFIAPQPLASNAATSKQFPFRLNTGRVRDQWHSMTRSGLSPRLGAHLREPFVEVHCADAATANLTDGGFARVASRYGSCVLKVAVTDRQRRGSLFAPIHWSGVTASAARIGDLVMPETDPYSGQPDLKATPASISPVHFAWRGFLLTRSPMDLPPPGTWWARVAVAKASGLLLASNDPPAKWRGFAQRMFGSELAEYFDEQHGIYRAAALAGDQVEACLFIAPADAAPQWDAVTALFAADDTLAHEARRLLLSGSSADGIVKVGPIICACFGVGLATICEAIRSGGATTVEHIGKALHAGTNCGSCLPELKRIVAQA